MTSPSLTGELLFLLVVVVCSSCSGSRGMCSSGMVLVRSG